MKGLGESGADALDAHQGYTGLGLCLELDQALDVPKVVISFIDENLANLPLEGPARPEGRSMCLPRAWIEADRFRNIRVTCSSSAPEVSFEYIDDAARGRAVPEFRNSRRRASPREYLSSF